MFRSVVSAIVASCVITTTFPTVTLAHDHRMSGFIVLAQGGQSKDTEQQCRKERADTLAACIGKATDDVLDCQKVCEDLHDVGADLNDCRRDCSEVELEQKTDCYDEERATSCD